jgi:hypothetical protein
MRRAVVRQPGREAWAEILKNAPKPFGQLTRRLLHEACLYDKLHHWPASLHTTVLGRPVMGLFGKQLRFSEHALGVLVAGTRLELLTLACDLLQAERDVFRTLRGVA